MEKRLFEKYFSLPLEAEDYAPSMVWTKEYDRAFDILSGDTESKKNIVLKLNGEIDKSIKNELTYEDGTIFIDGLKFINIRSWGRLTGTGGGLGLHPNKAAEIQDDFAKWIIEKLQK